MNKEDSIGIVIPTLNAAEQLQHLIPPLKNSKLAPRILVVDSSSSDDTVKVAKNLGVEVISIPRCDFNHGATREMARRYLNTDIVVMFTSDAYPINRNTLEQLVAPIKEGRAEIAYGRQIPYPKAGFFEAFSRQFNYPPVSHIRTIQECTTYGVYTFFCSDSFAAYRNSVLDEVGGFPDILFGEDTIVVAKLLQKGYRIAYAAEAIVQHSHAYTLIQEFCRYFDTGMVRAEFKELFEQVGSDTSRGKAYMLAMLRELKKQPYLLPYAFAHLTARWMGYKLGRKCVNAPVWLKKRLSSQPYFWSSSSFLNKLNKKL